MAAGLSLEIIPRFVREQAVTTPYPEQPGERDHWIIARRVGRNPLDPFKPHAFLLEEERAESGEIVSVATIFLTNRECPWRCLMCDLWKNTLAETVRAGAIPAQIDHALARLVAADVSPRRASTGSCRVLTNAATRQIKLYNSGSFFDPRAIPPEDHEAIARRVAVFERVIVECHPALVGEPALRFRDLVEEARAWDGKPPSVLNVSMGSGTALTPALSLRRGRIGASAQPLTPFPVEPCPAKAGADGLGTKLELAMGLETAHPEVLEKLNKRMTLDQFRRAAEFLRRNGIALRVFVLVRPPFLHEVEALDWAGRSVDFAFDCGATVVSLVPTRFGNGALEELAGRGQFSPPKLPTLEAALEYGIGLKRGRVFVDLWDLEKFSDCPACVEQRRRRLHEMNLRQMVLRRVICERCGGRIR